MTEIQQLGIKDYVTLLERIFAKLFEDLFEAYHRLPAHSSSKPYIERALRLAQAGLNAVLELKDIVK